MDTISVKSIEEAINLILKDYNKSHTNHNLKRIISIEYTCNTSAINFIPNAYVKAHEYPSRNLKRNESVALILLKINIFQGKTYILYQNATLTKKSKKKQSISFSPHLSEIFVITP